MDLRRGRLSTLSIAAAVAVPVLALGGVEWFGLVAAVTAALAANVIVAIRSRALRPPTVANRIASAALWSLAGWQILQLVPLPPGLLAVLSPRAAELRRAVDAAVGTIHAWHPISLDVPATTFKAVATLAVASTFDAASLVAASVGGRRRLLSVIAVVVSSFAVLSLAHPAVGWTRLYGVFPPPAASTMRIVPSLLNANHAAALAAIGPPILVAIAWEAETAGRRAAAVLAAAVTGAVCLLTFSRGGMAVLAFEAVAVGALLARSRTRRRQSSGPVVALTVVSLAVAGATFVALDRIVHEATNLDPGAKGVFVRRAFAMTRDFAVFGVGRGAMVSSFAAYEGDMRGALTAAGLTRVGHVESWPVQLVLDLGWPAAIAYAAALATAGARSLRGALSSGPTTAAATIALFGLVVHDLADFSLEFAGVGSIAAVLLAVVTMSEKRQPSAARAFRSSRARLLFPAVASLLLAPFLVASFGRSDAEDADALAVEWQRGRLAEAAGAIAASMKRHPADPYFFLLEGVRQLDTQTGAAFLYHAVELGPWRGQTHYWLARWFVRAGRRPQAWAEYRAAASVAPQLAGLVLEEMISLGVSVEELEAVDAVERAFDRTSELLTRRDRAADAEHLDEWMTTRFPPAAAARARQIERLAARGEASAAHARLAELLRLAPGHPAGYLLAARLATDATAAEAALRRGLERLPASIELLEALVRMLGKRDGLANLGPEIDRLRSAIFAQGDGQHRLEAILAEVAEDRGDLAGAIEHRLAAAATAPNAPRHLEIAAALAERVGNYALAAATWRRLADEHPEVGRYRAALQRVMKVSAGLGASN